MYLRVGLQPYDKCRIVSKTLLKQSCQKPILDRKNIFDLLLTRLASAEMEAKIVALVLEDIPLLSAEQVQAIRTAARDGDRSVKVTSAFPVPATQRGAITQRLQTVIQDSVTVEFKEDSRLLAGLRLSIGPWLLHANLEDELQSFTDALRHDSQNQ